MAVRLKADVSGVDRIARALGRLEDEGNDPGELLDVIGAHIEDTTVERFETNKAPDGTDWLPSGRARRQSGRTLVDSGRLRDSVTRRVTGKAVHVGTNVIYAAIHQFGGEIQAKAAGLLKFKIGDQFISKKSVDMPARPFLGLSREDEHEIPRLAERFIARKLGEALP